MKQSYTQLINLTSDDVSKSDDDHEPTSLGPDFGFAFNDSNFSDRILTIEIIPDLVDSKLDGHDCSSIAGWARNRKRRRDDFRKENGAYSLVPTDDHCLTFSLPYSDDPDYEILDGEAVAMIEESHLMEGVRAVQVDDSLSRVGSPGVLRVRTVHISSPILAAKSPCFYKLFSNGMQESDQRQVTLRIHASEEAALMDLLNFIYTGTLQTNTPGGLLDVLMAADKFEVASCMRYCSNMLRKFTVTSESALLYLDLPSGVLMAEAVKPLTDEAKKFLTLKFKDLSKYQEEVLNLPLAAFEAIISSDQLQVASEDAVFDLAIKWVRTHYLTVEERREILRTRLCRHLRFPYMTCRKLHKVLTCSDIESDIANKLVIEALFFKARPPYRQRAMLSDVTNPNFSCFIERAYKYRPIKVLEFETPRKQCIVYLDLKKEECQNLYPSGRVYSQAFHLGGQGFFLSAHCNMDQQGSYHCFGLFLGMQEKGSASFSVEYEFAARQKVVTEVVAGQPKVNDDYVARYKGNYTFMGGKAVGYRNLFGLQWNAFMADDCPFFVNGVLHIRAQLTIR